MFRFLTALTLVTLTALVLAHSSPPAYAATDWEQVGVDIDGEANGNQSGYSVSLSNDGSIVAVGEWRTASLRRAYQESHTRQVTREPSER